MKDEALRLALEAMESFQTGTNGLYEGEFEDEITAIKAALEAKDEPIDIYEILACSVECSVFENQVAPALELNGFGQKTAPNLEKPKPQYWTRKRMGYDREYCEKPFTTDWEPLYTTPPQSIPQAVPQIPREHSSNESAYQRGYLDGMAKRPQPLTDKQIADIISGQFAERNYWVKFARAIEAAHGIKGET